MDKFETAFKSAKPLIRSIAARYCKLGVPKEEIESKLSEEFWKAYKEYDSNKSSFTTWIKSRLRDRARDAVRDERRRFYGKVSYYIATTGSSSSDTIDDAPTSEIADEILLEDYIIRRRTKKKEADKRQLVDFLLSPDKALNDPVMVAAIDGIKRGETVNAIAKSLGLPRNTVDRKIQRLARNYDPKIHGDISDYLPDGVRIKREFITA